MYRLAILAGIVLFAAGAGVVRFTDLERRLTHLDDLGRRTPAEVRTLDRELELARLELTDVRRTIESIEGRDAEADERLRARLADFEARIEETRDRLEHWMDENDARLEALDGLSEQYSPDRFERQVREARVAVDEAIAIARENNGRLATLDRDVETMWTELLGPTVQLAGESTVGSGVLLRSRRATAADDQETFVITAWHVVRDIRAEHEDPDPDIPVAIYGKSGEVSHLSAKTVTYDADLDVALLRLDCDGDPGVGARLPTRERLDNLRVFDQVYAVGCPLGNDPIPTRGEIADDRHVVDGKVYWMLSAPTYIGNSGGGIFDASSHELLGIFSKIYTHGSLRPTVVPHMGLATPLSQVYDWLEAVGQGALVPPGDSAVSQR